MEINQILIPEKKKISITDILEEAWELCFFNLHIFLLYMFMWLIVALLAIASSLDLMHYIITTLWQDYVVSKHYDLVYLSWFAIIVFMALTCCLSALLRALSLRYEGEEHRYGKVMKQAARGYFRYFFVLLSYLSIWWLGFKLIANSYWLYGITGYQINKVINFVLLIPVVYFAARYFPCLTAAIVNPSDRSAFKTSAYLMKNNYCSGILIILLISSMANFLFSISNQPELIFGSVLIALFSSFFVICMNFIYHKKLEALKGILADAPELRKKHPAISLLIAAVISLIPLSILFPDVPRNFFYSNDYIIGAFSRKISLDNGISIKRPTGWYVEKVPPRDDSPGFYNITKAGNKMIDRLYIKLKPLNNSQFRKDKLNPEELSLLKNIFMPYEDTYDRCVYKTSYTIQEMNNQQEYPKGILIHKRREERKKETHESTHTYFYRVIDNKYIVTVHYAYLIHSSSNKENKYWDTTPEKLIALQSEREEVDAYLKAIIGDRQLFLFAQ